MSDTPHRRRLGSALLGIVLLAVACSARADQDDAALWIVNQVSVPVSERWSVNLMTQARIIREIGTYERSVVRPWVAVKLPWNFEAAVGYDAHLFENPRSLLESRGWQRLGYEHDWGRFKTQVHFWQEERFIEGDDEVAWRSRFLVGATVPLPYSLTGVVRNEFFINLNKTDRIRDLGLGENQFFAGFRRRVTPWLRVDVGYLMQFLERPDRDVYNHGLLLGFSITTPSLSSLWNKISRGQSAFNDSGKCGDRR